MIRVNNIKVSIIKNNDTDIIKKVSKNIGCRENDIKSFKILKKSIDARDKNNVLFVYDLLVDGNIKGEKYIEKKYKFKITGKNIIDRVVVVGSGPAGLFCSYFLAKAGYKPLIIERGKKVEDRVKDVCEFWNGNKLNTNSNVQFGEGGAGTFSDGKLNTTIKDKEGRIKEVLKIFVENGAPEEISYINKPHIGTNKLVSVVKNIREKIISMGGEFMFNATLTDINIKDNKISSIIINNSEVIDCNCLVLAIGHSARDTFRMLDSKNIYMEPKGFAVGVRISHPRSMIDVNQYGKFSKYLGAADYKLTYNTKDKRGVYSFCMCPGGYIVNASSENKKLAINGMSDYERNSKNSNSAIVVSVNKNDFGSNLFDGMNFQERLEEKAYEVGKGLIPVQRYIDFKNNVRSIGIESKNIFKGEYNLSNVRDIFPSFINDSLVEGIEYFATKIDNFNMGDAIIAGVESRTSSPIRIKRDIDGVSSILGIYPCGEGAGYAGGIMSAAVDGIKTFENIIKYYKIGQ